jgi:group I intron endonuclease
LVGIYCIENLINGKQYIGKSEDLNVRINHIHKTCKYLYRAIKKYGKENFKKYIIEYCDIEHLSERERYYIKKWKTKAPNGYNLTDGGEGTSGYKFTKEQKRTLSIAKMGIIQSEETKKKNSESHKGIFPSEESKKKMSIAQKGRIVSEEARINIGKTKIGNKNMLGKHHSEKSKKQMSDKRTGIPMEDKVKQKISDTMKGVPKSEETKENMSKSRLFKKQKNSSSKYLGVYFREDRQKWRVAIIYNKKRINVGTFKTEKEAAEAYNKKVIELYGDEAILNIIDNSEGE